MSDCPSCGQRYTLKFTVHSGDRHADTFPAPPYSTFKRYARVCVDPEDRQVAQGSTRQGMTVHLHRWADLAATADPTLRLTD